MNSRKNRTGSTRHPVGARVKVIHADAGHYATGVIKSYITRLGDERYAIDTDVGMMTPVIYPERIRMGNAFTVEPV